jgi:hypothetical protein
MWQVDDFGRALHGLKRAKRLNLAYIEDFQVLSFVRLSGIPVAKTEGVGAERLFEAW